MVVNRKNSADAILIQISLQHTIRL